MDTTSRVSNVSTIKACYERRQSEIRELMRDIVCQLQQHSKKQKADPTNAGCIGDLVVARRRLREVSEWIGGARWPNW